MTDLIDTTEMYLKTVFELLELGITPMRARIAERLHQSGPTVSQTVARMERDGLLFLDDERVIHLSIEGERIATGVMRKHRLAERHLIDVIGLEYSKVHEEACGWEHVMSLDVERKIASLLTPPYRDPYGNPIPGLAELECGLEDIHPGVAEGINGSGVRQSAGQRLVDCDLSAGPCTVRVASIGEVIQSDVSFLADLEAHGVVPASEVRVYADADAIVLETEGGEPISLTPSDAGHIGVDPV